MKNLELKSFNFPCIVAGDRYSEEPTSYKSKAEGNLDEIDDWDKGKKSVAQEVLGKAKEIWNKTRGFDEPPDYGYVFLCFA